MKPPPDAVMAVVTLDLDNAAKAISDSVALVILERSNGRIVQTKIISRSTVMQWLRSNINQYPRSLFRVIIANLAPMHEIVAIDTDDSPAVEAPLSGDRFRFTN